MSSQTLYADPSDMTEGAAAHADQEIGRAKPQKSASAFRTISEVAEDLNVPQHVLRFWETRFFQVRPLKRGGGRRYYRPEDVALIKKIHHLLYVEGYTIKGVQKLLKGVSKMDLLKEQGVAVPGPVQTANQYENAAANQDGPDQVVLDSLVSRAGLSDAQRAALETALQELQEMKALLKAAA